PSFQVLSQNSFKISAHQRLMSSISITSPTMNSNGSAKPTTVAVQSLVWQFQPTNTVEIMAGRDALPTGLGSPDPATFIRTAIDPESNPYPTQIKAFWRTSRWQLTPYLFGPGGNEAPATRKWGSGILAGTVLGNQRAVIGVSADTVRGATFDATSVGGYARVGLGKFALLSEYKVAARTTNVSSHLVVGHQRLVYVPREW